MVSLFYQKLFSLLLLSFLSKLILLENLFLFACLLFPAEEQSCSAFRLRVQRLLQFAGDTETSRYFRSALLNRSTATPPFRSRKLPLAH
jgi:hypothetical protein